MRTIYADGDEYDLLGTGHTPDAEIAFYAAQAPPGTATLELACGTGRLAVPLAERGLTVTGVDTAPAMLAAAERKAARHGVPVRFIEADMRRLDFAEHFGLIFLPNNSLGHLHALDDIRACFDGVRRHLAPGGKFVIDMFNPSLSLLLRAGDTPYPVAAYTRADGARVSVTATSQYDSAAQISHSLWRYEVEGEAAEVRALALRIFFPQELDGLLRLLGFVLAAKYGSFEGEVFAGGSRQQLVVCVSETLTP